MILSQIGGGMSFISSSPLNRDNFHIFFSVDQIFVILYILLIGFDFFEMTNFDPHLYYIEVGAIFCHFFIIEKRPSEVRVSLTL